MNYLLDFTTLTNTYLALRHGESLANVEGIIVSTPDNGIPEYGLSDNGKDQVLLSATNAKESGVLDATTFIISSDFKRARETAEITQKILASKTVLNLDAKLRERDFGDFELMDNTHYQTVWNNDAIDSSHTINNAESADAVMKRVTKLIASLEKQYNSETFLLVAHGDTIQILQTAFKKLPASKQREMIHLETAEIRKLTLL